MLSCLKRIQRRERKNFPVSSPTAAVIMAKLWPGQHHRVISAFLLWILVFLYVTATKSKAFMDQCKDYNIKLCFWKCFWRTVIKLKQFFYSWNYIANVSCSVVVPKITPQVKCDAIQGYGAELTLCDQPTDRKDVCDRVIFHLVSQ